MSTAPLTVLVIGATGSIGRLAVEESISRGHRTRALVRDAARAASLPAPALAVVGDPTRADTLSEAVDGVDAELVDYGAVRNTASGPVTPPTGVVSRRQIAQVLVASLTSHAAAGKTLELDAQR